MPKWKIKDKAGSSLVTMLFVLPLLLMTLMSIIDGAMYVADRTQLQSLAKDTSRTVAIFGGAGNSTLISPIEKKYGLSRRDLQQKLYSMPLSSRLENNISTMNTPELMLAINALNQSGLVATEIKGVHCSPSKTDHIGVEVKCSIKWEYANIPLSFFTVIGTNGEPLWRTNTVSGTSQSEVSLLGQQLVSP